VEAFMPWYSSVHRGAGLKSEVATAAYEAARQAVRDFLRASSDDAVVFTRNTTDAVNLLSRCLPEGTTTITTLTEHHANLLPWRGLRAIELPVPASREEALERLEAALRRRPADQVALVAVTGASNVTGEVWPIAEISALAHRYGARVFVDAAQLAAHRPIDMAHLELDWVAISGHKLYAPFGAGALVGRSDWLESARPYLLGGGAAQGVGSGAVTWEGLPRRHEGGSPNVVGAVALAASCRALCAIGMDRVAQLDTSQSSALDGALEAVPGVQVYRTWAAQADRVAVRAFACSDQTPALVAAVLSAEHGIGVRSGSFCAHPLLSHLSKAGPGQPSSCGGELPGLARASMGLGSGDDDIARLATALAQLLRQGPHWRYRTLPNGTVWPDPDDRPWPEVLDARLGHAQLGPSPLVVAGG